MEGGPKNADNEAKTEAAEESFVNGSVENVETKEKNIVEALTQAGKMISEIDPNISFSEREAIIIGMMNEFNDGNNPHLVEFLAQRLSIEKGRIENQVRETQYPDAANDELFAVAA